MDSKQVPLAAKLNLETARAPWRELQPFFANGSILWVREDQDMFLVAEQIVADNVTVIQQWLDQGKVAKVSDEQALGWFEQDAELWTLVIKPWILVQERD